MQKYRKFRCFLHELGRGDDNLSANLPESERRGSGPVEVGAVEVEEAFAGRQFDVADIEGLALPADPQLIVQVDERRDEFVDEG